MAQSSFPFENIDTTETQYSQLFRTLNNGVNGTPDGGELEVDAASAGLAVDIAAGQAMVRGHFYISTEVETRSLAVADATNDRIDLVVLRLDPIANTIILAVKTGTPDPAPVAPALVQTDGGLFEQPLANVLVEANAGIPGTITDRREFMGTKLGTWTTDGRPVPAGRVLFGFNTTLEAVEFYDPINEVWGPVAPEINSLDDIGDVTITTPADGELLAYDDGTSEWVNQALTSAQLPAGSILQVVSTLKTDRFTTASGTPTDITGFSATITPSSASSKIFVMSTFHNGDGASYAYSRFELLRDSTVLGLGDASGSSSRVTAGMLLSAGGDLDIENVAYNFLDSPGTTSAVTYKWQVSTSSGRTMTFNGSKLDTSVNHMSTSSTITLMEVAG